MGNRIRWTKKGGKHGGRDNGSLISDAKLCVQAKPSEEPIHHLPWRGDVQPLARSRTPSRIVVAWEDKPHHPKGSLSLRWDRRVATTERDVMRCGLCPWSAIPVESPPGFSPSSAHSLWAVWEKEEASRLCKPNSAGSSTHPWDRQVLPSLVCPVLGTPKWGGAGIAFYGVSRPKGWGWYCLLW